MELLSNGLIKEVREKIVCWMEDPGIEVCMNQGSSGFENYIQVKLAGFLRKGEQVVKVESSKRKSADILLCRDDEPKAAFELKVGVLGKLNGKGGVQFSRILDDIDKLKDEFSNAERVLICVIYQNNTKGYSWGPLMGEPQKGHRDYQDDLRKEFQKRIPKWDEDQGSILSKKAENVFFKNFIVDIFLF